MLEINIDSTAGLVIVEPQETLSREDFQELSEAVDRHLEQNVSLHGLMIKTRKFPGWDSFAAFTTHIRFIRDHHQKIEKVALVTDSAVAYLAPVLAKHFISAEIKTFPYADHDIAINWLTGVI